MNLTLKEIDISTEDLYDIEAHFLPFHENIHFAMKTDTFWLLFAIVIECFLFWIHNNLIKSNSS